MNKKLKVTVVSTRNIDNGTEKPVSVKVNNSGTKVLNEKRPLDTFSLKAPEDTHKTTDLNSGKGSDRKLKQNEHVHTGEKPFTCNICHKNFRFSSSLRRHMLFHAEKRMHVCAFCEKKFITNTDLTAHMSLHTKIKPLVTDQHNHSNMKEKIKRTVVTYYDIDSVTEELDSIEVNHSQTEIMDAKRRFDAKLRLQADKESRKTCNVTNNLYCETCGKVFDRKSKKNEHVRIHTGEKPFSCYICCKNFRFSSNLKQHMLYHAEQRMYTCSLCEKKFFTNADLTGHMSVHTKIKPLVTARRQNQASRKKKVKRAVVSSYNVDNTTEKHVSMDANDSRTEILGEKGSFDSIKSQLHTKTSNLRCETCGKVFDRKSKKNEHVRVHTGEKPFTCDICYKNFTASSYLKRHMLYHAEKKTYACFLCKKKFFTNPDLTRHMSVHTKIKPFVCIICEKSFARKDKLKSHVKLSHCKNVSLGTQYGMEEDSECCSSNKQFESHKHDTLHTASNSYKCEKCDESFAYSYLLKNHMRKHNPIVIYLK